MCNTFIWRGRDLSWRLLAWQLGPLWLHLLSFLHGQLRFDVFSGFNSVKVTFCSSLRLWTEAWETFYTEIDTLLYAFFSLHAGVPAVDLLHHCIKCDILHMSQAISIAKYGKIFIYHSCYIAADLILGGTRAPWPYCLPNMAFFTFFCQFPFLKVSCQLLF